MGPKIKRRRKDMPRSRKRKRSARKTKNIEICRQEVMEFAGIGLYRYKFDGTVLYMDPAALRILDLESRFPDPSRVVGMNISDLMIPRGPRGMLRRKVRQERRVHHFEYPFRTLSGIDKWTLHDCYLVKDPDSGEEVIQTVVRDITERKSMEEVLQVSEKRYRLLLETSPDMVFQMDRRGNYLYVNPPAARVLNRRVEELMGHNQSEFLSSDLAARQQKRIDQVVRSGQPVHSEAPYLMGADPVWVETRMVPIKNSNGEVFSVLDIVRDIGDRKREEMRLEELNDCFLQFGSNHIDNIHRLVSLCGRILGATCALYNRLQDGMLHALAHWNAPPDFMPMDRPEGHICHHVIQSRQEDVHVIRDLPNTSYAQSDPHVLKFGLKTYIGKAVSTGASHVGSLCVVYQRDFEPSENDRKFLSIVAAAIGIEEQRRGVRQALQEQRDFAENLIEASQAIILVLDSKGCIVRFNPYLEQISGWRLDEVQGRDWFETFVPVAERPHARELFTATIRISALGNISPILTRNGATRLVEWFSRVLKDDEGRVIGLLYVGQDITERKRAEETLQKRERFFQEVLNSVQDGVSILDPELTILFANSAMDARHSHSRPLAGRKCFQAYHGRQEKCANCPSIRTLQTRQPAVEVVPLVGEGKQARGWVELHTFPMLDSETGELKGVIEYVRNITEQKRTAEALKQSEYLYRTTMDSLQEWIHVVNKDLRIVHMNEAFKGVCRELGIGGESQGRKVGEIFPFLPPQVYEEYRMVFQTGKPVTTFENTTVKDRTIVTETRKEPVFEDGEVVRVITVIRDITEKHKLEQELLKIDKLESVGILAGGIAHDFNNILTVLLGNISLATMMSDPQDKMRARLAEMEKAALMAKDLTEQLLAFSKAGTPVKSLASMDNLLRESTGFALRGSNVKGEFDIAGDLRRVEVDVNQIGRVMNNLIINAVQAMPSGGTVAVRAANAAVTPDQRLPLEPGDYIRISVEDHGPGIPKEDLRRIFDPFFTTKEKGSGLGLSICYSIVAKHQGHIFAESEPGRGSTFHIYLPSARA